MTAVEVASIITGGKWVYDATKNTFVRALDNVATNPWSLDPFARGVALENLYGHNVPAGFRTIDRWDNVTGTAASIKSMDLNAVTYQTPSRMSYQIKDYIDSVAGYTGTTRLGHGHLVINPHEINFRVLDLVVPNNGSAAQQQVINQMIEYGRTQGVQVNVIVHP